MTYRYLRPLDLAGALAALQEHQAVAMPVAGATNFLPDFRDGRARPRVVVDIARLPLRYLRRDGDLVRIGALTTVTDLLGHAELPAWAPVLAAAAGRFAGHLVRNRATIGGNLADASPAADLAPPLLALGASVTLTSAGRGERHLPLTAFFQGVRRTARQPDELLTEITFPLPAAGAQGSHFKFGLRDAMAISVVSGAILLELEGAICTAARVALGAVAPTPVRAPAVEAALVGRAVTPAVAADAAARVGDDIAPISDVRASAEYRLWVAEALVRRHILAAVRQAA